MNKEWSELNKTMQAQIKKKDTYKMGIDTLFNLRRQLMQTLVSFKEDLCREDFNAIPFINADGYHNMKHKLHELYHLLENSDGHELSEKIGAMCIEFEQIDEKQYSDNPIVDSVLRIKFGRAKARGIKVETSIRIPKKMQLDHGDIGVLYGNLVDNAVEACSKVPEEQRFVKIENKYQSGILLLVITNSKTGKKNKSLKTTKKDNIRHGHGVQSVRKVVEKYNGTVSFTDKGDIFEVSAMLYGIEVKE